MPPQVTEQTATAVATPPAATKSRSTKQRRKGRHAAKGRNAALDAQFEARVAAEVVRRVAREVDARKFQLGQDNPRDMPNEGPARILPAEIEPVTGIFSKEYLDMLAFMEEKVTVRVQTTPDKNADPIPGFWVNGRSQYFPRGVNVTCRRCYVEQLARSRTKSFTQEEYIDSKGWKAIRNIPTSSLNFPFQVMRDDNPDGIAWLEKVLAEE